MQNSNKTFNSKMYMVMLIFMFPMLLSWALYYFHDYFHFKTLNHGTLVNPPISVPYLYASLPGKDDKVWRVVFVDEGFCDAACEKMHYQLKQVQKALGKDHSRVRIVLMGGKEECLKQLQTQFAQRPHSDIASSNVTTIANKIYLIDPLGNLFMYYSSTANPMHILKDLKKVLGVSQIG